MEGRVEEQAASGVAPGAEEEEWGFGLVAQGNCADVVENQSDEGNRDRQEIYQVELEVAPENSDMVDSVFRNLPRRVGQEATNLFNLLLVQGCEIESAKLEVCELYSLPRATKKSSRLPVFS